MLIPFEEKLNNHIYFTYSCFDRIVLRGYLPNLFVEGSVIKLLRNLGFKQHGNGVMKTLTDQLNSHINKLSEQMNIQIHWWGNPEKERYHSKLDFVKDVYGKALNEIT